MKKKTNFTFKHNTKRSLIINHKKQTNLGVMMKWNLPTTPINILPLENENPFSVKSIHCSSYIIHNRNLIIVIVLSHNSKTHLQCLLSSSTHQNQFLRRRRSIQFMSHVWFGRLLFHTVSSALPSPPSHPHIQGNSYKTKAIRYQFEYPLMSA